MARKIDLARLDAEDTAGLAHERGNFLAALRCARRSNDADLAFELAIAGYLFWYLVGRFAEGEAWLTRCLTLPIRDEQRHLRAAVHCLAGHFALLCGHLSRARRLLADGLRAARAVADAPGIALALHFQSLVELHAGNLDLARAMCEEGYIALQRVWPDGSRASLLRSAVLTACGRVACELGEQARASDLASQAASAAQAGASRFWHARALHLQALIAARAGQRLVAFQLLERAIKWQRLLGDEDGRVDSLCTLGQLQLEAGLVHDSLSTYVEEDAAFAWRFLDVGSLVFVHA